MTMMNNLIRSLLGLALAVAAPASTDWPVLPVTGFITGRSATQEDIAAGNAVFAIGENASRPMSMEIPQFAYWSDEEGRRQPVIVVQAESGPNGEEIVGLRGLDGSEMVVTLSELTLLGTARPE
jgi:hypothetical protein